MGGGGAIALIAANKFTFYGTSLAMGNRADSGGGFLLAWFSNVVDISESIILSNEAMGSHGGALLFDNINQTISITSSVFRLNVARQGKRQPVAASAITSILLYLDLDSLCDSV